MRSLEQSTATHAAFAARAARADEPMPMGSFLVLSGEPLGRGEAALQTEHSQRGVHAPSMPLQQQAHPQLLFAFRQGAVCGAACTHLASGRLVFDALLEALHVVQPYLINDTAVAWPCVQHRFLMLCGCIDVLPILQITRSQLQGHTFHIHHIN